mgnify:CR=1 FL=1
MRFRQLHAIEQKQRALDEGLDSYAILHDDDPVDPLGPRWSVEEVSVSRDALRALLQEFPDPANLPSTQRLAHQTLAIEAGLEECQVQPEEPSA